MMNRDVSFLPLSPTHDAPDSVAQTANEAHGDAFCTCIYRASVVGAWILSPEVSREVSAVPAVCKARLAASQELGGW